MARWMPDRRITSPTGPAICRRTALMRWFRSVGIAPPEHAMRANRNSDTGITRSTAAPALSSEFDKFLYAPVGEVNDDMPFSVLSALARQNVDPWEEAAELARLSTESAIVRLTSAICSATGGPSTRSDATANAARLVALLPRSTGINIPWYDKLPNPAPHNFAPVIIYLIVGALIIVSALLGN
jgi:hypothetical protein